MDEILIQDRNARTCGFNHLEQVHPETSQTFLPHCTVRKENSAIWHLNPKQGEYQMHYMPTG